MIRQLLLDSTLSVAPGDRLPPVKGIMLSLDLSKAFDCVPGGALIQALQYAGVDATLQAAILEVHERCRISHGRHKGSIRMGRGIRQGCLSPCLYSSFSAWLHHKLASRASRPGLRLAPLF